MFLIYSAVSIVSSDPLVPWYSEEIDKARVYFDRRRKLRRAGDTLLFLFAVAEILLIGYAATLIV